MSILIDTGVFYAFYNRKDIHHPDSLCLILHALEGRWGGVFTTILVVAETATLLRYRVGVNAALAFLDSVSKSGVRIIFVDEELYEGAVNIFSKYRERELSLTDASIIAVMMKLKIGMLATYDERSFGGIVESVVGSKYSQTISQSELEKTLKEADKWLGRPRN
ncbi:MAG: PIN domain-containing protein [Candidatus Freyarchaeum deiterrae]